MPATLLKFPRQLAEDRRPVARRHASGRVYTFADVVRIAGLDHVEIRTAISTLRDMVRSEGLPPPITTRRFGGKVWRKCAEAVGQSSLWNAAEVDHWDMDGPSPNGAAQPVPRARDLHDHLRANARTIAGVA